MARTMQTAKAPPVNKKLEEAKKAGTRASRKTSYETRKAGKAIEDAKKSPNVERRQGKTSNPDAHTDDTVVTEQLTNGTKRKREAIKFKDDDGELPHGLGDVLKGQNKKEETHEDTGHPKDTGRVSNEPRPKAKSKVGPNTSTKKVSSKAAVNDNNADDEPPLKKSKQSPKTSTAQEKASPSISIKNSKSKAPKSYSLTPGATPFPNYPRPTITDCHEVYDALASLHGESAPPKTIPAPSEIVAGCGEVPAVLDAMIRTYLSSNTTGRNSSAAFQGLVKTFGTLKSGIGKGSVDWNAVRLAPQEEVFEAIKHGGLGQVKSKTIKATLNAVYEENLARRNAIDEPAAADPPGAAEVDDDDNPASKENSAAEKQLERMRMDQNVLSLDHYHTLSTPEAQTALTKFPGIGVKTSSCVLLFCMQRPSFAVDTHVFRLASWLGWIPDPAAPREKGEKKVDRDTAFSHLEVRIPDELKYGLHQLFIKHGKTCPRCRAITGEGSEGWEGANCPIEKLVKRTGARKRGDGSTPLTTPKKGLPKGKGKGKKEVKEEKDGEEEEEEDDDDDDKDSEIEATKMPKKGKSAMRKKKKKKKKKKTKTETETEKLDLNGILASEIDDSNMNTPRSTRSTRAATAATAATAARIPTKQDMDSELSDLDSNDSDEPTDDASDDAFSDGGSAKEEEE